MMELKPCPLCGKFVILHGPEDWHSTFYDPDSGGEPYNIECECGLNFSIDSYDFEKNCKSMEQESKRRVGITPTLS